MKKKIILIVLTFIMFQSKIYSLSYGGCDYSTVSRLKSLVNNINLSYSYHINNNSAYFDVTINNIDPSMYFIDTVTNKTYYYSNTNNGEITIRDYNVTSGSYRFYSARGECYGISLGTKYYNFPIYNIYHNNTLCKDLKNISICKKWVKKIYSYDELESKIYEYKDSLINNEEEQEKIEYNKTLLDNIVNFYVTYYYYFLIAIILVCIILMLISNKKNKFNL